MNPEVTILILAIFIVLMAIAVVAVIRLFKALRDNVKRNRDLDMRAMENRVTTILMEWEQQWANAASSSSNGMPDPSSRCGKPNCVCDGSCLKNKQTPQAQW